MSLVESYPVWSNNQAEQIMDANLVSGEVEHFWEAQLNAFDDIQKIWSGWFKRHRRHLKSTADCLWSMTNTANPGEQVKLWTEYLQQTSDLLSDDFTDAMMIGTRSLSRFWIL